MVYRNSKDKIINVTDKYPWIIDGITKIRDSLVRSRRIMDKQDMSNICGFNYEKYWIAANDKRTMSQNDWDKWYDEHCGKCKYMCIDCMYGEE